MRNAMQARQTSRRRRIAPCCRRRKSPITPNLTDPGPARQSWLLREGRNAREGSQTNQHGEGAASGGHRTPPFTRPGATPVR